MAFKSVKTLQKISEVIRFILKAATYLIHIIILLRKDLNFIKIL